MSRIQSMVSISTTEDEYNVATHANKEEVQLQQLCSKIGFEQQVVWLDCDNQSAIFLEKNIAYHSKTKNIDVQYHFIREMVEKGKSLLEKVDTIENVADLLTEPISTKKFSWCRSGMGLVTLSD